MNNQQNIDTLKSLGLSDQEIVVYTALLKLGGADATLLAKQAGLKRTTAYPILDRLIKQSIVIAYEQGAKKFYSPIAPSKLGALFEEKVQNFFKIVPVLEKMKSENTHRYGIRLIQTKKDLRHFYNNILDEYKNGEYLVIGSATTWLSADPEFMHDFRKRRAMNNTKVRLLLTSDSEKAEGQKDSTLLREYKYLPDNHAFKSTIDIYKDKIIILGPTVDALAVVIEIPPMVDVFKSTFEVLWGFLPEVK